MVTLQLALSTWQIGLIAAGAILIVALWYVNNEQKKKKG